MNALQLRPPSEEPGEHLLRRPVRRLPYPTTEHLPLGMFHSREEGDGQRTADQKLLDIYKEQVEGEPFSPSAHSN